MLDCSCHLKALRLFRFLRLLSPIIVILQKRRIEITVICQRQREPVLSNYGDKVEPVMGEVEDVEVVEVLEDVPLHRAQLVPRQPGMLRHNRG